MMSPRNLLRRCVPIEARTAARLWLRRHPYGLRADWPALGRIGLPRPCTVVDVGAHAGRFVECVLAFQPWARVLAFEPLPDTFRTLERKFLPFARVRCFQAALGPDAGERTFHVSACDQMSSFLETDETSHPELRAPAFAIREELKVKVHRLSDVFAEQGLNGARLLKLDVQGYELDVLKGAEEVLPTIDYICAEAQFYPLYKGAPLFTDLFAHLRPRGFDLVEMTSFRTSCDGRLMECDMIFRNRRLRPTGNNASPATDKTALTPGWR